MAALLLFLGALAACGRPGGPSIVARWRCGLGAVGMAVDSQARQLAVVCARSNDVWVLDLASGAARHRIDTLPRPRAVIFHPDKDAYDVAEGLSSVAQVRLEDERVARRFRPRSRVSRLAYEPTSGRIFAGHVGLPTLGIYRLRDMHQESSLAVGGEVVDLAFTPREAWLATRQADALVRIALADLSVKAAILAGPDPRGLDLRPDDDLALLACHGRAGEAAPLALPTPVPTAQALSSLEGVSESAEADDTENPAEDEAALAAEPDDNAASGGWDGGGVAVFRLSDSRRVDYVELPGGPVAALAGRPGRAAVACEDGQLRIVDLEKRKVLRSLALGGRPGAMIRHPDGKHLLVALFDQKLVLEVLPGVDW